MKDLKVERSTFKNIKKTPSNFLSKGFSKWTIMEDDCAMGVPKYRRFKNDGFNGLSRNIYKIRRKIFFFCCLPI